MHIILLQDVDKVGKAHEIVKVKDGYGRNYLIPQGLAIVANASNKKVAEERARQSERRRAKIKAKFEAIKQRAEVGSGS